MNTVTCFPLLTQLLAAPCIIGVLMVPTAEISFGLLVPAYITAETWLGPGAAIVQVSSGDPTPFPFWSTMAGQSLHACDIRFPIIFTH